MRVVITGMGALTPIGNDVKSFWQNATAGISGASPISYFDTSKFKTKFACSLKDFDPAARLDRATIKRTDLYAQYALCAVEEAVNDANIQFDKGSAYGYGVIWGTGQGGMLTFEETIRDYVEGDGTPRFSPFFIPKMIANMASGMISIRYGLMGINYTTVSACATSNTAIMDAYNYIKSGKAKVIVTGGSEAPITPASIAGFNAMKALSTNNDAFAQASRPFDRDRDGFVMGEGAGALILESYEHAINRGARIYAEVVGAAMTADAYHITSTHPEGIGAAQAMRLALDEASLSPEDIDYINAHATSTGVGDLSELQALSSVFGDSPKARISATKSMTGHLLGAAGAVEAILAIKSIEQNVIPPSINTVHLDPKISFPQSIVIGKAKSHTVRTAMSNTFGFGGHNAITIFREI